MAFAKGGNAYDYSRFKIYQGCQRKHKYRYEEEIVCGGNKYTIPGVLFHSAVEIYLNILHSTGKYVIADLAKVWTQYDSEVLAGNVDGETGTLQYVFDKYIKYYEKDSLDEEPIHIETTFYDPIEETDDYVQATVDLAYRKKSTKTVGIRDTKTTLGKLKYTFNEVTNNQQMLFYIPFVENTIEETVETIEIDEVRIARLKPVPLLTSGKPARDKQLLELVTLEDYEEALDAKGLLGNAEYNTVLDWMQRRGHPLFNRVKVNISDRELINSNMADMLHTYQNIKTNVKPYRSVTKLCEYCEYKQLCDLDRTNPSDTDRQIIIDLLTKGC